MKVESEHDAAESDRRDYVRELAIILAALRYWQRCGDFAGDAINDIATNINEFDELTAEEIDDLCERLNCGEWGV